MKPPRLVVFVLLFIIGQESQNGPVEVDDTAAIPALPKIADVSCNDVLNILIPDWDISCGDNSVDSSALTAISSNFLANINLNWTTLGLEDAFSEAVKYVYDNHLDSFSTTNNDTLAEFQISVTQVDEYSMTASLSSTIYMDPDALPEDDSNSTGENATAEAVGYTSSSTASSALSTGIGADSSTLPNGTDMRPVRKRQGTSRSFVLKYNPKKQGTPPALAGYPRTYSKISSNGFSTLPAAKYIWNKPTKFHLAVTVSQALDMCLDHYVKTLAPADPSLRSSAATISVGLAQSWGLVYKPDPYYSVTCYYNPGPYESMTFNKVSNVNAAHTSETVEDVFIYERTESCAYDTNMVQNPPECLWTEYGSKNILETVAARSDDSYRYGFFDSFMQNLGNYVYDGKQGIRMDCDILTGCVEPLVPGATATDLEIGAFMITTAIYQQYSVTRILLETFNVATAWAAGVLPGIVDMMRVPETKEKPEDDSFDVLGLFDLILGTCPLGKAGEAIGGVLAWYEYIDAIRGPRKPSITLPQPNLFDMSFMFAQTSTAIRTAYVDQFALAVGSQHPSTKKKNFLKIFDWHSPPALLDTVKNNFTESVEVVKGPMVNYIIAKVFESTRIPLLKFYRNLWDSNAQLESWVPLLDTPTSYRATDDGGMYRLQPLVWHHWNGPQEGDDPGNRDTAGHTHYAMKGHLGYTQMLDVSNKLSQYWSAEQSWKSAVDCQNKRTNGEFPQDYNGKVFYPKGAQPLDAFTDVNNIGAYTAYVVLCLLLAKKGLN
ncbi:uncharacterized protein AB675_1059 [Cyphellophora attinorum]|uniref:Uncharacterized protein n=1 Tax=Cyphellophora attinorum TaxID=1664694 RepID=A0A0N1HQX7_9EURO|nr:uncharacterized protein AB675_1059 [Phialophora attinorum]KPI38032.1 hypothetical protein AB675_1059 [Phialophora attinorum]